LVETLFYKENFAQRYCAVNTIEMNIE